MCVRAPVLSASLDLESTFSVFLLSRTVIVTRVGIKLKPPRLEGGGGGRRYLYWGGGAADICVPSENALWEQVYRVCHECALGVFLFMDSL